MAWIPLNQSVFTHKKTMALAEALDIPEVYAVGHLASLWSWCMDNAPDGVLVGITPRIIARAAQWTGTGQDFLSALLDSGYLAESEDGYVIPNWMEYGGKLITQKEKDAERKRVGRSQDTPAGHTQDTQKASAGCPSDVRRMSDVEKKRRDKNRVEVIDTPLIPQGGARMDGRAAMPMSEEDTDAFTPQELYSEPLPPPAPKQRRATAKAEQDSKRLALMQAFRAVRFGRPLTDPIPDAEFARMKNHADDLLGIGATPEQVANATDEALNRTEAKYVTLGYIAGHWTEVTTPLPKTRPTAVAGPVRLTAAEQRDARLKAEREADYEQMVAIERELFGGGAPPVQEEPRRDGRVLVSDAAFNRPASQPRRITGGLLQ